jgi:hypothetical protein
MAANILDRSMKMEVVGDATWTQFVHGGQHALTIWIFSTILLGLCGC